VAWGIGSSASTSSRSSRHQTPPRDPSKRRRSCRLGMTCDWWGKRSPRHPTGKERAGGGQITARCPLLPSRDPDPQPQLSRQEPAPHLHSSMHTREGTPNNSHLSSSSPLPTPGSRGRKCIFDGYRYGLWVKNGKSRQHFQGPFNFQYRDAFIGPTTQVGNKGGSP
jgi:hypothetical protein